MKSSIRPMLVLAAGLILGLPALGVAASQSGASALVHPFAAPLKPSYVRVAQPVIAGSSETVHPKQMGNQSYPGSPGPNPFRAYPPSCAADPLPDRASGLPSSAVVPLYDIDSNNHVTTEQVTVTVWRIACSSSGNPTTYNPTGAFNAMTLMRIDRADDTDVSRFPTMPLVQASQGTIDFDNADGSGNTASLIRVAAEPNTVVSEAAYGSLIRTSTTFVLENYPYVGSGYFTYSDAFTLRLDPLIQNVAPVDISIPAYNPTPSTYPDAYNPLSIDGYEGTNFYDPSHSGEGMQVLVADNGGGARTFFAAWYTYDPLGLPFWITAQGVFNVGATSVNATGYYQTGGGFAGDFGSSSTQNVWGNLTFSFPDCNTMDFSYSGQTDATTNGPGGTGERTWTRLADNNGMTCE